MSIPLPIDLDALSLDELKKLVVQLLQQAASGRTRRRARHIVEGMNRRVGPGDSHGTPLFDGFAGAGLTSL